MSDNAPNSFLSRFNKRFFKKLAILLLLTIKWSVIFGIISCFLAGGVAVGYVSALVKDDPIRNKQFILDQIQENAVTSFAYFNDETVIGQLRSDEDRRLATINEIPKKMQEATLAIEDKDFYNHYGIDINGFIRAVKQKLLHEDVQTGGSTITQQLARRVFLSLDREVSRKFKEIFLSLRLERMMSKDEILTAYLNKIPYGNGSSGYNLYGIKAAAKGIFNIDDLNQLNDAQCAYLAGLPQQPSNYSAFFSSGEFDSVSFKKAVTRQQLVLKRMLEEKKINEEQFQEAMQFDLKASLAERQKKAYNTYPYLMIDVEKNAADILINTLYPNLNSETKKETYNEAHKDVLAQLQRGGYKIYTTIDKTVYDSMHVIAEDKSNFTPDDPKKGIEQVGSVMIDNKTGAILGMIEGRNFFAEQLNHATQAYRQPGSTMKPIAAYIPAIEKGAIQPGSVIDDVPIVLKDGSKGFHIPENWDTDYHGLVTARRALNQSYNIPAIKLFLYTVGIKEAWDYAKKMGINSITKEDYYAQTGVIGGLSKGVSVEELTNAYTTIANKGVFQDAYIIQRIVDTHGKTVFEHDKKPSHVFSEETAYLMTDMMRTVITDGTAPDIMTKFKHYNKIPVVGKTGSTQDDADAWYMGFSPDITLGVWVGYDQPIYKLSKATGGTSRAKNIWAYVMDAVIDKKPELFPTKKFDKPDNIIEMTVSDLSGKLPSELTKETGHLKTDIFNKNQIPTEEDDVMVNMKYVTYNGVNYIPQALTPADMLKDKIVIKRQESVGSILKKIKDVMDKLPEEKRKSLNGYIPLDASEDAPSEIDPRVDDAEVPKEATGLALTRNGDNNRISFTSSTSADVVGYRLYRSINRGPFQKVNRNVVLSGQDNIFTDPQEPNGFNGYYISAVDASGRESSPSKILYADGTSLDKLPLIDGGDNTSKSNGGSIIPVLPGPASAIPSAPSGVTAKLKGQAFQINWAANAANDKVKHYNVYYSSQEKGTFKKLGFTSNTTEFLYYSSAYDGFYRITAENEKGESPPSPTVIFKK